MAEVKKICECCGKEFIAKSKKAKYCSPYCRGKLNGEKHSKFSNKNEVNKKCLYCGKEFIGHYNKKYCCPECQNAVKNKKARDLHILQRELKLSKNAILGYDYVVCPICGLKFLQITSIHFKIHGYNNIDEVYRDYPDLLVTCNKFIEKNLKGENNPMSSKNKSELERKQASPYSLEHYYKKGAKTEEDAILMRKLFLDSLDRSTWILASHLEYYTRQGYSLEEAKELRRQKYATNTIEHYIKLYGPELAVLKKKERVNKWKLTLFTGNTHSKISDTFFEKVANEYNSDNIFYGNNEYTLVLDNITALPDFIDIEKKKIIEFYGDYWHCNPIKYSSTFFNKHKELTAKQIWEKDNERILLLKNNGYDVLIIWEYEVRHNFNLFVEKSLSFLYN